MTDINFNLKLDLDPSLTSHRPPPRHIRSVPAEQEPIYRFQKAAVNLEGSAATVGGGASSKEVTKEQVKEKPDPPAVKEKDGILVYDSEENIVITSPPQEIAEEGCYGYGPGPDSSQRGGRGLGGILPLSYSNAMGDGETDSNFPVSLAPWYSLKNAADTTLVFESRFEGGNLYQVCSFLKMLRGGPSRRLTGQCRSLLRLTMQAFRRNDYEYDLVLQPDTNTSGHTQWFYFQVC